MWSLVVVVAAQCRFDVRSLFHVAAPMAATADGAET